MLLATTEQQIYQHSRERSLESRRRPGEGFHHPQDVVEDADLNLAEKRAVLAAWASDASAVQDEPTLRWLLGTPQPIPLTDVLAALTQLDVWEGRST